MAKLDNHGLPMSTTSDAAAAHYREGVTLLLATWPGAAEQLDAAIAADPDFALAHAARARLHALYAEPAEARTRIADAEQLAAQRGTERERSHVAGLVHVLNGRPKEALSQILAHLDRWPQDTLIFSLPLGAFGLFAFPAWRIMIRHA